MKKVIILLMFLVFTISLVSSEIIIRQEPSRVYNLGDSINLPVTIKSSNDVSGIFEMNLICEGHKINFYRNGVMLPSGQEKQFSPSIILTKNLIGDMKGICKAKGVFEEEYKLTKEFTISTSLDVNIKQVPKTLKPGENFLIKGDAIKENGKEVNGFVELSLEINEKNNSQTKKLETVKNGFFEINTTLPEKLAAGKYQGTVNVYEKNEKGKTNQGKATFEFSVAQIPTNLEIIIEKEQIKPEGEVKIKTKLHDQTGENIPKPSTITITNPNGIIEKKENRQTDKFLTLNLPKNETPGIWNVSAVSGGKTSEAEFEILENKETEVTLTNNTVFIENVGNVHYNNTVQVKIGNKTVDVPTSLDIGETKKYYLEAPEGNYTVEVLAGGKKRIQQNVQLTGKSISVKETLEGNLIRNPVVWGFVIIILGIILYIVFRKGYKRSFIGRKIHKKKKKKKGSKESDEKSEKSKKKKDKATEAMKQGILPDYKNKAELSLSIKGNKQDANLICLKINNYDEVKQNPEGTKETLHKITKTAEHSKAYIYEANENIFFIYAPEITRTFKNEKTAIKTAKKIESDLRNHNKYFKQRIDFGLSVNRGEIILKKDKDTLKFMSVGKLTTSAKKLASISKGETLLTKDINEKLNREFKTERGEEQGESKENKMEFYRIKEIKDRGQNQKFLNEFVKRYKEDENKGKEKKKE